MQKNRKMSPRSPYGNHTIIVGFDQNEKKMHIAGASSMECEQGINFLSVTSGILFTYMSIIFCNCFDAHKSQGIYSILSLTFNKAQNYPFAWESN